MGHRTSLCQELLSWSILPVQVSLGPVPFLLSCLVTVKDTCWCYEYGNREVQDPLEGQGLNLLTSEGWLLLLLLLSSRQAVSDSSRPHGLQHTRLPCPSPSPRVCSSSCPVNQWCHPTISSLVNPLLLPSIFTSIRVFSNESAVATEPSCVCFFFSYLSLPCLQSPNSQKFGEEFGMWQTELG